jgi:sugar-specific transcriptional regulator TrmB
MTDTAEVKKNLYSSLKELGLADQEADLYVASLSLGPSPIATIATRMDISRPNIYKVIAGLERHGLVAISKKKKYARNFIVEPPTAVLEKLRLKKETISGLDQTVASALPDLLAIYHQGETPTKIKIIEGDEQFREVIANMYEEVKGDLIFFGSIHDFIGFLSKETFDVFIKRRSARKIFVKTLITPSDEAAALIKNDTAEMRETRVLKNPTPFETSFHIAANKALVWQPKTPLAVLIEDEYIVAMLRSMFNMLWGQSK